MRKSTQRLLLRTLLVCVAAAGAMAALFWLWLALDWGQIGRWALVGIGSLCAVAIVGSFIVHTVRNYRAIRRREDLMARYGDEAIIEDLLAKVIWQGETANQVRDSLGEPVAIDAVARKTKHQEVWKYGHEFGNRYRLRITLDDGIVVRWEMRD